MTISSTTRKAGPYSGNDVTTAFGFSFKVFKKEDVQVTFTNANGTDSVLGLDSDYSVVLNVDQDNSPGGTVIYPRVGSPLAILSTLEKITVTGALPYTQPTDIPNLGPWFPEVVEDAFDRAEIQIQQLKEITDRSIKISVSDTPLSSLPSALARANTTLGFDALGNVVVKPDPAAIGAGDMRLDTFVAGADFNPGATTQLPLSRAPGNAANLEVFFDGFFQGPDQWSVNGAVVTFTSAIPVGVGKVFARIGTTLSSQIPPAQSVGANQIVNHAVGDEQLGWGDVLSREVASIVTLRDLDKNVYTRAGVGSFYGDRLGSRRAYALDPADTTSVEDVPFVVVATDGGRWKLLDSYPVDLTAMGARPDNSTDGSAALQKLFSRGLRGYSIPGGRFKFGTPITNDYSSPTFPITGQPSARADIRGQSMSNSILNYSGTGYAIALFGSDDAGAGQGIHSLDRYSGFTLQEATLSKLNNGLYMKNRAWWKLEDLAIQYHNVALGIDSSFTGKVVNCFFSSNNYGALIGTGPLGASNIINFDRCTFSFNTKGGVIATALGSGNSFRDCTFESNGTQADLATGGLIANLGAYGYSGPLLIDNCYFEHNAGIADISIDNTLTAPLTVIIRGCTFVRSDGLFFTRNNINVTSSGGGKVKVLLEGCNFITAGTYVADPSKPFWTGDANVTFIDNGGNQWNETTSIPTRLMSSAPRAQALFAGSTVTTLFAQRCTMSRTAVGQYRMTFDQALLFADFVYNVTSDAAGQNAIGIEVITRSTTVFEFKIKNQAGTAFDPTTFSVQVFGM